MASTLNAAGFGGWLFQSAGAPLMSASCVVLSIFLMSRMASRRSVLLIATTVLVVVAGFESSTWIGGIAFVASALVAVPVLVIRARLRFVAGLAVAGVAAAGLAAPCLHDQLAAAMRGGAAALIAIQPFEVVGDYVSDEVRGLLDPPAYWLVLLVVELPAVYVTGSIVLAKLVVSRQLDRPPDPCRFGVGGAGRRLADDLLARDQHAGGTRRWVPQVLDPSATPE
jgi:hypothetical protein